MIPKFCLQCQSSEAAFEYQGRKPRRSDMHALRDKVMPSSPIFCWMFLSYIRVMYETILLIILISLDNAGSRCTRVSEYRNSRLSTEPKVGIFSIHHARGRARSSGSQQIRESW